MNFDINRENDTIYYYNQETFEFFDNNDILDIKIKGDDITIIDVFIYIITGIKKLNSTEALILKHIYEETIKDKKDNIIIKEFINKYSNSDNITNITYTRNINNLIKKGIIKSLNNTISIIDKYKIDNNKQFIGITIK